MTDRSLPEPSRQEQLRCAVASAARFVPVQGPIGVFIHHNTLHALEHLPFEEAVTQATHLFGAEPCRAVHLL